MRILNALIITVSILFISANLKMARAAASGEEPGFEMEDKDTLENRGPGGLDVPQGESVKPTPKPQQKKDKNATAPNSGNSSN